MSQTHIQHFDHDRVDVIGDVHGCSWELLQILHDIGFLTNPDWNAVNENYDRGLILVGDLTDRGPDSASIVENVQLWVESGLMTCIHGNHDNRLGRHLLGRNVQHTHGLDKTIDQIERIGWGEQKKIEIGEWLMDLPVYVTFHERQLVVAHGALPRRYLSRQDMKRKQLSKCVYAVVDRDQPMKDGLPNRVYDWCDDYNDHVVCVYGHQVVREVTTRSNTYNIDTGCVFGGCLTCLRYDEGKVAWIQRKAAVQYAVKKQWSIN